MKFTTEIITKLSDLIRMGVFAKTACEAVGISEQSYYRWQKEHVEFCESIKKARAEGVASAIAKIRKDPSWVSAAWYLERVEPENYHLATGVEHEILRRIDELEKKAPKEDSNVE